MKIIISILSMLISLETNGFGFIDSINRHLHMPSNGYWVVENDPRKCDRVIVHYYDDKDNMLHSEPVVYRTEKFLNYRLKRKFNKKLKQVLLKESSTNVTERDNKFSHTKLK
jgi:hypothetical protein